MSPDLAAHLTAMEKAIAAEVSPQEAMAMIGKMVEKVIAKGSSQEAAVMIGELERLKAMALKPLMMGTSTAKNEGSGDDLRHLSVPKVAALLDLPKARVYELIRQGEIPSVQFGKTVRVPLAALRGRLAQNGLDKPVYQRYTTPRGGSRAPATPTAPSAHAAATLRAAGRHRDQCGPVGAGRAKDRGAGRQAGPASDEDRTGNEA